MNEQLKHIELLEAYHEGKLSHEEKVEFEVRLLVDNELQQENELYTRILFGFHDIKADQIRNNLKKIDQELDQKKTGGSGSKNLYWLSGIAATIALICFVYFRQYSEARFSTDYIPEDPGLPVLMGVNSRLEFDNAMSQFKAGNFEAAEEGFSTAMKASGANDTIFYYLGICTLHAEKFDESVGYFEQVLTQPNSLYAAKSQFYMALTWWAKGNTDKSKAMFATIAQTSGHVFQEQAQEISRKFD
jgi:TolA-binding protein